MPDPLVPASARSQTVAQLHDVTTGFAGGYQEGLDRAGALARLAAITADPDLLAEAAARHATAPNWYAIAAVELLIEAGADRDLIDEHIGALPAPPR
ncbi:MAG: hypothetical protein HOV79_21105 [Hamadaea sp.]|nr:hypothetical protein [Hamadaea sp.]